MRHHVDSTLLYLTRSVNHKRWLMAKKYLAWLREYDEKARDDLAASVSALLHGAPQIAAERFASGSFVRPDRTFHLVAPVLDRAGLVWSSLSGRALGECLTLPAAERLLGMLFAPSDPRSPVLLIEVRAASGALSSPESRRCITPDCWHLPPDPRYPCLIDVLSLELDDDRRRDLIPLLER